MSASWSAPDPRRTAAPPVGPATAPPVGPGAASPVGPGAAPPVDPADPFATLSGPPGWPTWPADDDQPAEPPLVWRDELRAGSLVAVATVLTGAPVGLAWAALAPRVDVVVDGQDVNLTEPSPSAFIAGDGYFLGAVLLAGLVTGLVVWWLARPAGPGLVAGLALGSTLAALVAMLVGQDVGVDQVQAAVEAGRQGALTLNLQLRAREALVGWPVAALVAWTIASLVRGR